MGGVRELEHIVKVEKRRLLCHENGWAGGMYIHSYSMKNPPNTEDQRTKGKKYL